MRQMRSKSCSDVQNVVAQSDALKRASKSHKGLREGIGENPYVRKRRTEDAALQFLDSASNGDASLGTKPNRPCHEGGFAEKRSRIEWCGSGDSKVAVLQSRGA